MTFTVEATYEDGVLKPRQPLPLKEHQTVRVTLHSAETASVARQTAGMIPWTGDAQTLEQLACDPEHGLLESP